MYEDITIPDNVVDELVETIATFACKEVAKWLPTSEAYEGFQEEFITVLYPMIRGYSTSVVEKEA